MKIPSWFVLTVIGIIVAVCLINFAAPFFVKTYKPDPALNAVFLALVGGMIPLLRTSEKSGKHKDEDS